MIKQGLHYTIAGENNPYWIVAEPILFQIWAEGIPKASVIELHITNLMSFAISTIGFLIGVLLRSAVVGALFFITYLIVPEWLINNPSGTWLYQVISIILIVSSVGFVLGERLFCFIGECLAYLFFAITNMIPLRLLACGLRKERYLAQAVAKTSFMGMYIVQTIDSLPRKSQEEWRRVFDLYEQSNTLSAREELEKLAAIRSRSAKRTQGI